MKNNIFNIFAITFLAIFFTFSTAGAGERVKVFEMGESGFTVEFPMTPAEIAAEEDANGKIIAGSKISAPGSNNNVKVFEMGEGGHTVAFPISAEEIAVLNGENARLAAAKAARLATIQEPVVRFELAESGHFIEFSAENTEMALGDLVIAQENPVKNILRAR